MGQGPREWVLGRLDALLPEPLRAAPAEELGRHRALLGTSLLLLLFGGALVLAAPFFRARGGASMAAMGALVLGGLGPVPLLLRRGVSPWRLSLWMCGLLVGVLVVATVLFAATMRVAAHVSVVLLPLLAVYLLGVRPGLLITGLCCLDAALLTPLLQTRLGVMEGSALWVRGGIDGLALLLGWGVSALFGLAREEAANTVRESEGRLTNVLESTEDAVCSMDPAGHLLVANAVARRMFLAAYGRELRPGDALDERSVSLRSPEWGEKLAGVLLGQSLRFEWSAVMQGQPRVLDCTLHPLRGAGGQVVGVTLFGRDITERRASETKLEAMHRSLLEVSRQAGMAEVATGVLHNVGNTLNSVNVSATLMLERLGGSRAPALARAVELLRAHASDLSSFLAGERGRQLPEYLASASQHLAREHDALREEARGLLRNVEHIRAVVGMQQRHARQGGRTESLRVPELIDDALRLYAHTFERQGIHIHRDYTEGSPVVLDRHRLLQIVVNLLNNARQSLVESGRADKRLSIRVWREGEAWMHIEVGDNGVGIARSTCRACSPTASPPRRMGMGSDCTPVRWRPRR